MSIKVKAIGEAVSRIDGFLKVTGRANYVQDFPVKDAAFERNWQKSEIYQSRRIG